MIGVLIALGLLAVYLTALLLRALARGERTQLRTTLIQMRVPGLPDDLAGWKLALVADLHVGRMYVPRERLLQALADADPDYLALAGDYAAGGRWREEAMALLGCLAARWPMVCTLGNTEIYQKWDVAQVRAELEQAGSALLVNDSRQVPVGAAMVEFIGLDDPKHGKLDVAGALAGALRHPDLRVVVAHSPAVWRELGRLGAHVLLCGHTHGGQVRVPGMEALTMHPGIERRLAAGLFRYRQAGKRRARMERRASHWRILSRPSRPLSASTAQGPLMYVTRGIGATGPRVRLFCPPELVLIEFTPAQGGDEEAAQPD